MTLLDPKMENLKYEMEDDGEAPARIKVIGVGGGGSNAVAHMMASGIEGVEFHVLNTDAQALRASPVPNKLAIGCKITRGRGAGADPDIGKQAALEDTERILEILEARTWSSSRPAWAAAPAPERPPWSRRWPKR